MNYGGKTYKRSRYRGQPAKFAESKIALDILSLIDSLPAETDLDDLVGRLLARYEVGADTLRGHVVKFIERCIRADVLVNGEIEGKCDRIIQDIQSIQEDIKDLAVSHFGFVARLGSPLSPGCQSCQRGKWAVFFIDAACNRSCYFCPYSRDGRKLSRKSLQDFDPGESISLLGVQFHSYRDLKYQVSLLKEEFDAFAWLGGEPMLPGVLKRILPLIEYFHGEYPAYHQWLYTNGTLATVANMQALYDAGIRELRFNLAATDFSPAVIGNMKRARRIFDCVCLEIPMLRRNYEQLDANMARILDTGLDQMNLIEFMVGENHLSHPEELEREGELYNYRGFITSPVQSRKYTYKIIKRAWQEKWPVVINDCSNEYKYHKLSVQQNKRVRIFQDARDYWNNSYAISEVDAFNDRFKPQ
jgi:pyruvate formate-lyase activating enzyme-like uncharacterized protein